ncbi:MAG TPA: hypothetical protein PK677_16815 [Acidiphilium sp.]|nr:hypothetical protein [Acidiphilium sp.]
MTLETTQAAHRAAVENHQNLRAKAAAAETALSAAKSARVALLAAAGRGDPVKPGDLAKAQAAIDSAETDAAGWREAAEIARVAERAAKRQLDLEGQIKSLSEYRKKCEGRAALADDVAAKIQAAREALAELERVDAQTAAAAPRHAITMGGQSPIASRILPPLDQPSTRGINNPPRRRDDVLAGVMRLPTGTDHLREIDREIARARETATLDARRRTA